MWEGLCLKKFKIWDEKEMAFIERSRKVKYKKGGQEVQLLEERKANSLDWAAYHNIGSDYSF